MKQIALWLVLATVTLAAFSSAALADRDPNVQLLQPAEDTWYNYDFDDDVPYAMYADFPVAPVWRGQSSNVKVSTVKSYIQTDLGPGYPTTGSTKYSQLSDGGASDWDPDGGKMTNCYYEYGNGKKRHIRVYAPNGYQLYNSTWGYYVTSNVHAPHWYGDSQCSGGADAYGWSEDYEGIILGEAAADGKSTYRTFYDTLNAGGYWEDYNHYQKSDGYASRITFQ